MVANALSQRDIWFFPVFPFCQEFSSVRNREDEDVANAYSDLVAKLGVKIALAKSLISDCGYLEFAKRFCRFGEDLSPISVRMIRSARHSVAWAAVFKHIGTNSYRVSLRMRGAGYHVFSRMPLDIQPGVSRHWLRHTLVMFSPRGVLPLPFPLWLAFPTFVGVNCYHIGMVRARLVDSFSPNWAFIERLRDDLNVERTLDGNPVVHGEEADYLVELWMFFPWVQSLSSYCSWYYQVARDYERPIEELPFPVYHSSYVPIP